MKAFIEALEIDLNTVTDSGVFDSDYQFYYNTFHGYSLSVSFTYNNGEMKNLKVMLDNGGLPTPEATLEQVTKVCLEFCEDQNQLEGKSNSIVSVLAVKEMRSIQKINECINKELIDKTVIFVKAQYKPLIDAACVRDKPKLYEDRRQTINAIKSV